MIRITSKKDGFRRCGVVHSATPMIYPDDHFKKKDLKILQEEPMLFVEQISVQEAKKAGWKPEDEDEPKSGE